METVSNQRVRKLMQEHSKHGNITRAAEAAGVDRKTAAKYIRLGRLPSQVAQDRGEREYRTRKDPFAEDWPKMEAMLAAAPELEVKALFTFVMEARRDRADELRAAGAEAEAAAVVQYEPGQVRTLQRRVKTWRASLGPDKEVFFPQEHRPGEALQTDFTWATELNVMIAGEIFEHMLCHSVLPHSNWQWATICRSENFLALKLGLQNAAIRLGRTPEWHQTDQSTTATHSAGNMAKFNESYKALVAHLGMKPRTIGVGKKEQNGDIEAANGALKRRLKQHLLLRGSCDFDTMEDYQRFLHNVMVRANRSRQTRFAKELATMRVLNVARLPDYKEIRVRVSSWSTIQVMFNGYSVPSRLIGEYVKVRIYDGRIEVLYAQRIQLRVDRLVGKKLICINYRHIIWSLVRKPGAFARYRYREELFPTVVFNKALDALQGQHSNQRAADRAYLRILHHAAATMECNIEAALELLLEAGDDISVEAVKDLVGSQPDAAVPDIARLTVDLAGYDQLTPSMEVSR